jgi:UDP-glucuronate 4-epimerase
MSYIGKMGYVSGVLRAIIDKFVMPYASQERRVNEERYEIFGNGRSRFYRFTCQRLLDAGHQVVGIDNLNDYYDVNLKLARLDLLKSDNFLSTSWI